MDADQKAFLTLTPEQQEILRCASEEAHCYESMGNDWFQVFSLTSQASAPPFVQGMSLDEFQLILSYGIDFGRALQSRYGDAVSGRIHGSYSDYKNEVS